MYKHYEEMKDSGIQWLGEIPSHWKSKRIKNLLDKGIKSNIPAGDGEPVGKYPFFTSSQGSNKYLSYPIYQKESLILGDGGSFNINYANQPFSASSHSIVYSSISEEVELRYLYYYLFGLGNIVNDLGFEGMGLKMLQRDFLMTLRVHTPTLEEQRNIVDFVDQKTATIDNLIEKKEALIKLLKEKRQVLINEVVTKGLNPNVKMKDSGIEWIGEIPQHWEVKRIKNICRKMISGPFGSSLTKDVYTKDGYKIYGQEQVISNNFELGDYYISKEKYLSMLRYKVEVGDLLVSCVGTFGKISVVPKSAEKGIINPRLIKFSLKKDNPYYMKNLLSSYSVFSQIETISRGTTMGVINLSILSEVRIPLPPIEEQVKMDKYIREKNKAIECLLEKINFQVSQLKEYRQTLVFNAVTGKIDVR